MAGMKSLRLAPLVILFLIAPYVCGGNGRDGENGDHGRRVFVSVSPARASVEVSQSQQFTVRVSGSPHTAVTWSVNGIAGGNSTVGTVDSSGFYTAPSTVPVSSVTVTADVSVTEERLVHRRESANAAVIVMRPQGVSVTISPNAVSLRPGQAQQFSAWVSGTSDTAVHWSVNGVPGGSAAAGTITIHGLYTTPSRGPIGPVTVTARSISDSASYANARVAIQAHQVSLSWSASRSNVVGYH